MKESIEETAAKPSVWARWLKPEQAAGFQKQALDLQGSMLEVVVGNIAEEESSLRQLREQLTSRLREMRKPGKGQASLLEPFGFLPLPAETAPVLASPAVQTVPENNRLSGKSGALYAIINSAGSSGITRAEIARKALADKTLNPDGICANAKDLGLDGKLHGLKQNGLASYTGSGKVKTWFVRAAHDAGAESAPAPARRSGHVGSNGKAGILLGLIAEEESGLRRSQIVELATADTHFNPDCSDSKTVGTRVDATLYNMKKGGQLTTQGSGRERVYLAAEPAGRRPENKSARGRGPKTKPPAAPRGVKPKTKEPEIFSPEWHRQRRQREAGARKTAKRGGGRGNQADSESDDGSGIVEIAGKSPPSADRLKRPRDFEDWKTLVRGVKSRLGGNPSNKLILEYICDAAVKQNWSTLGISGTQIQNEVGHAVLAIGEEEQEEREQKRKARAKSTQDKPEDPDALVEAALTEIDKQRAGHRQSKKTVLTEEDWQALVLQTVAESSDALDPEDIVKSISSSWGGYGYDLPDDFNEEDIEDHVTEALEALTWGDQGKKRAHLIINSDGLYCLP